MRKIHRIMLFTIIVSILAELAIIVMRSHINYYFAAAAIDLLCLLCGLKLVFFVLRTSTSFLWLVLQLVLLFVLSPCLLRFLSGTFNSLYITYEHYVFYAPVSFILLAFVLGSIIASQEKKNEQSATESPDTIGYDDQCQYCGQGMFSTEAFCPHCYRISHRVYKTIEKYPQKHHLDFTLDFKDRFTYCPHCGSSTRSNHSSPTHLTTPIQSCRKCNDFYVDYSCYEWSVISPIRKIGFYFRGGNFGPGFLILLVWCFYCITFGQDIPFLFVIILSTIILRIIWMKVISFEDMQESQTRLKNNPEYPQILADMGYIDLMDPKYIALLKTKREELL